MGLAIKTLLQTLLIESCRYCTSFFNTFLDSNADHTILLMVLAVGPLLFTFNIVYGTFLASHVLTARTYHFLLPLRSKKKAVNFIRGVYNIIYWQISI
jgi:hypothetical protein